MNRISSGGENVVQIAIADSDTHIGVIQVSNRSEYQRIVQTTVAVGIHINSSVDHCTSDIRSGSINNVVNLMENSRFIAAGIEYNIISGDYKRAVCSGSVLRLQYHMASIIDVAIGNCPRRIVGLNLSNSGERSTEDETTISGIVNQNGIESSNIATRNRTRSIFYIDDLIELE